MLPPLHLPGKKGRRKGFRADAHTKEYVDDIITSMFDSAQRSSSGSHARPISNTIPHQSPKENCGACAHAVSFVSLGLFNFFFFGKICTPCDERANPTKLELRAAPVYELGEKKKGKQYSKIMACHIHEGRAYAI